MCRSAAAKALWHDLDRVLRPALHAGASWDEAACALRGKADQLDSHKASGLAPESFRKFERL